MCERDFAVKAGAWRFVDEAHAAITQTVKSALHAGHIESEVMNALSPRREKLVDRRAGARGREQLELGPGDFHETNIEPPVVEGLPHHQPRAQRSAVERQNGIDVVDRNADVIEPGDIPCRATMSSVVRVAQSRV